MKTGLIILFILPLYLSAQNQYPVAVQAVLAKAGANKIELTKALDFFYQKGDSLKIKAIEFLVANMDIHYSASYYWQDSSGRKVPYNELAYPTYADAIDALQSLKQQNSQLTPVAFTYRDIDSIKADFLIDNVERAFEVRLRSWAEKITFDQFCEYILPYRASIEPLQNWRGTYQQKFGWINDSANGKTMEATLQYFANDQKKWFINTYDIENRKEPLPRLGSLQLLQRKKGPCEDIADLMVFALRSQGILVTNDMVSYWATSTGSHFFNSTLNDSLQPIRFDVSSSTVRFTTFAREPAKVIRTTFSKQPNTPAFFDIEKNIPNCFLRAKNIIDVTKEYWPVRDLTVPVFSNTTQPKLAYAAVFNGLAWRPTWWAKVLDGQALFTNMCQGAVFLPMYCINGIMVAAGYPMASGYNNTLILKPDTINHRSIHIKQQDKYLIFRPGKNYKLYYWNKSWVLLGAQKAQEKAVELVFDKAPRNALYLLLPEYSQGKERPFMITDTGERIWW